jgi:hypothetical protein
MTELSFKNWQVDLVRVTAFYGQIDSEKKQPWSSWWTDLVGVPPENTSLKKRDEILQDEGPFNGGDLILALQPGRIDWYLKSRREEQEAEDDQQGIICLKPEALGKFQELVRRWMKLDSCPPVTRLALGCVLLEQVESRQAGYLRLRNYLPAVDLNPDSSDFLYQINRPRNSRTVAEGLRVNRLCKWSVAFLGKVSFSLSMGQKDKQPFTGSVQGHGQHACRVEVDINSDPEYKDELVGDKLLSLFDEFAGLAKEIAEKGDVP